MDETQVDLVWVDPEWPEALQEHVESRADEEFAEDEDSFSMISEADGDLYEFGLHEFNSMHADLFMQELDQLAEDPDFAFLRFHPETNQISLSPYLVSIERQVNGEITN